MNQHATPFQSKSEASDENIKAVTPTPRENDFLKAESLKKSGFGDKSAILYKKCLQNLEEDSQFSNIPQCLRSLATFYWNKGLSIKSLKFIEAEELYHANILAEVKDLQEHLKSEITENTGQSEKSNLKNIFETSPNLQSMDKAIDQNTNTDKKRPTTYSNILTSLSHKDIPDKLKDTSKFCDVNSYAGENFEHNEENILGRFSISSFNKAALMVESGDMSGEESRSKSKDDNDKNENTSESYRSATNHSDLENTEFKTVKNHKVDNYRFKNFLTNLKTSNKILSVNNLLLYNSVMGILVFLLFCVTTVVVLSSITKCRYCLKHYFSIPHSNVDRSRTDFPVFPLSKQNFFSKINSIIFSRLKLI